MSAPKRVWTVQEFAEVGHELTQRYTNGRMAPDPTAWGRHVNGVGYPAYLRKELMILCYNVARGAGRVAPLGFDIEVRLDADAKVLFVRHYLDGRLLREVSDIFEALTG